MPVPVGVLQEVLRYEQNHYRFEQYCSRILSEMEGVPVLITSPTWDLGRDARDARGSGIFAACTLDKRITKTGKSGKAGKVSRDLTRLQGFAAPTRLYVCSSQPLSESELEKLKAEAAVILPKKTAVVVYGGIQLVDLDQKLHEPAGSPYTAESLYATELQSWKLFTVGGEREAPEEAALRLALVAMGQPALGEIRHSVYQGLLLDVLSASRSSTENEITAACQGKLRLGRPLPWIALAPHVERMRADGLVAGADRLTLTEKGVAAQKERAAAAVGNLLRGREAIRAHLQQLIDRRITDDEFTAVWRAIEQRLGDLMFLRGESIAASVAALVEGREAAAPDSLEAYHELVSGLVSASASAWPDASSRDEFATAVRDMFTQGTGPACDWLVSICGTFVSICSLGLETQSAAAIRRIVTSLELVLDTDVVLSLVGVGEPDHRSVRFAHVQWARLGGTAYLVEPVAAELAHHAWISARDHERTRTWLPGSATDRLTLIRNVFVRAFAELLAQKKIRPSQWSQFIREFRGKSERDTSRITQLLVKEEKLSELRPGKGLTHQISKRFLNQTKAALKRRYEGIGDEHEKFIALDKATRDAEVVAIVARRRDEKERLGSGGGCCLVTSGTRLLRLPGTIVEDDPAAPWVLSPAAWVCLVSLAPGVHLSPAAMHAFLFELEFRDRPRGFQETVLRAIKEAGEYRFGYARRGTLFRSLEQAVVRRARELGIRRAEVEAMIEDPEASEENSETASAVIAEALKNMAVETETEARLRERIAELEEELANLRKR